MEENPFILFNQWKNECSIDNISTLSTIDSSNNPKSRCINIISFNDEIFKFYTSYYSGKCDDIKYNENVCLLFRWNDKQIMVSGKAIFKTYEENLIEWNNKSYSSQVNSWNSYLLATQNKLYMQKESACDCFNITSNEYNFSNEITDTHLPLSKVPGWGYIEIYANEFNFSNEIIGNNRIKKHFKMNLDNKWIHYPEKKHVNTL